MNNLYMINVNFETNKESYMNSFDDLLCRGEKI